LFQNAQQSVTPGAGCLGTREADIPLATITTHPGPRRKNMATYHSRRAAGEGDKPALIFLFHGTGGDENQFFDLAAQLIPGAARLAVRGDVSEGGALRYFKRAAEGVYDMDDLRQRTGAMVEFIRDEVAAAQPSRVLGLGYSNGANIIASVQFAAPDLFDATVLMHPLIPFAPPAVDFGGRKVLITAGQRDPIAPAAGTQVLHEYFADHGAQAEIEWHAGGHEIRQEELLAAREFLKA
jgi:phospholipase/carboxylesterase